MATRITRVTALAVAVLLLAFAGGARAAGVTVTTAGATVTFGAPAPSGDGALPLFGQVAPVACASPSLCLAAHDGAIETSTAPFSAGPWTETRLAWGGGVSYPGELACPSPTLCVGAGDGQLVITQDPGARRPTWTKLTLGFVDLATSPIVALSCPSTTFCAATDGQTLLTSEDPAGGASTWHASKILNDSEYAYADGLAIVTSLSCTTARFCVAGVAGEDTGQHHYSVLVSQDPTGGPGAWRRSWTGGDVFAVSCAGPALCTAEGDHLWVSTHPAAPAPRWRAVAATTTYKLFENSGYHGTLAGLSCPTSHFCAATDGQRLITSTNPEGGPASWHQVTLLSKPNAFTSLACPAAGTCVAATRLGDLELSTAASGGAKAWTLAAHEAALGKPSCPGVNLCVAVDALGDIAWSTEPTTAGTWQPGPSLDLLSVDCPAVNFCAGLQQSGTILLSNDPTGGASAWTPLDFEQGQIGIVTCASATLCAAGNADNGQVSASSTPTDPTSWMPVSTYGGGLDEMLACGSAAGICMDDGGGSGLAVSENPVSKSSWESVPANWPNSDLQPDNGWCGLQSMCIAGINTGTTEEVVASANPAASSRGWQVSSFPNQTYINTWVCASQQTCFAVVRDGPVWLSDSDPTQPGAQWSHAQPDPGFGINGLACPSAGQCLATAGGQVIEITITPH